MGNRAIVLSAFLAFVVTADGVSSADGLAKDRMCWSPAQLIGRPGEEIIRKGTPYVTVPKRPPQNNSAVGLGSGVIRRVNVPRNLKVLALTFDLCEEPLETAGYQSGIVDFLRSSGTHATFFAGGKWLLTHAERAQQLLSDPLFQVANHTWAHRNLRLLNGEALLREIVSPQVVYEQLHDALKARACIAPGTHRFAHEVASSQMTLFRFPFGACDPRSLDAVREQGLVAVQWDVSSGDPWLGQTVDRMVRGVVNAVRPGSIVLFHANGRGYRTEEALPRIIEELKARGYDFVTVGQLLKLGQPEYSSTCYDVTPGDTDRYDGLAKRLDQKLKALWER